MASIDLTPAGKRFWKTKKRSARVSVYDRPVHLGGAYWSGGSKSDWYTVTKQGVWTKLPDVGPAPFDNRPVPSVQPTADMAVVDMAIFCGKPSAPTIFVTSTEGWTW